MNIQHINVTIEENAINSGALKVLEVIRPNWNQESIEFKLFTDGISNKLVGCKPKSAPEEDTVLVRIYGNKTDLLIDRKAETRNILLLNKVDLAPPLYATFCNGLAYEFVPGCTLTPETVRKPEIFTLIAERMARLHLVKVSDEANPRPILWDKLQRFLALVPEKYTDDNKRERYEQLLMPRSKIEEEVIFLKNKLSRLDSPVVFTHNDLLLGNVVYTEEKNSVTFIDFEYATLNYQAYDIGNHFAEFPGIDNIDYANYPNEALQKEWLSAYLKTLQGRSDVEARDIDRLYVQVNQFALVSHVFWGIWSLIQAEHSHIDFDFIRYASIRFDEYLAKKEVFLS